MKLHPRNREFVWEDPVPPFAALSAAQVEQWSRDGAFVLHDAFDAADVAAVVEALDPFAAASEAFLRSRDDGRFAIARAALTDADVDNGCPWILPGAHRLGTLGHRWTDLGFCCFDDTDADRTALRTLLEAPDWQYPVLQGGRAA